MFIIVLKYHIYIFEDMGVAAARSTQNIDAVAPRAPLLKFLEITTGEGLFIRGRNFKAC